MVVRVEVISREMIKPSSATSHQLRNLKLSLLDQIAPPIYVPMILFYQTDQSGHEIMDPARKSELLRQSLSDTLTQFYPLAGRIEGNVFNDCDDAGAEYVEARVHAPLSQVITNVNMEDLERCLPIKPYGVDAGVSKEFLLAIQTNFFDCGGMAIAVCISHKIADGSSLVSFLNAWAGKARGNGTIMQPNFDLATHFPPRNHLSGFAPTTGITKEKLVTRRFVFDKTVLEKLKATVSNALGGSEAVKDPTRVEAVSAFIWKHMMEAAKANNTKMYVAVHAVNLRPRMIPPQPAETSFGNLWRLATAASPPGGERTSIHLASLLREAIKKINNDFVEELIRDGNGCLEYLKKVGEQLSKGDVEICNFSSWCRFPVYEVDYGWGRPVWAATTTLPFKNVVILMSTRCGDGVEAWVNLLAEDMAALQCDDQFLSLFTTNY
ncbi:stemmadenine O-acetyltransferase-like [Diospyros lotus]|uniref:stemmadenine O-acetyltransferase-like n=1 Tax=Diospyros lotus TaxID=55363 RepID=UPI00225BAEFA|nr:stemmadenine O-acetyltransferase-like [Diospyros lotus]